MLANRLSVLLAERQLTNKQVVEDTGISRNTISNISNNPQANISTEIIDTLCQYLGIEPGDFFTYSPYKIRIESNEDNELLVNITKNSIEKTYAFSTYIVDNDFDFEEDSQLDHFDFYITVSGISTSYDDAISNMYSDLPVMFQNEVTNMILKKIKSVTSLNSKISVFNGEPTPKPYSLQEYINNLNYDVFSVSIKLPWINLHRKANFITGNLTFV